MTLVVGNIFRAGNFFIMHLITHSGVKVQGKGRGLSNGYIVVIRIAQRTRGGSYGSYWVLSARGG